MPMNRFNATSKTFGRPQSSNPKATNNFSGNVSAPELKVTTAARNMPSLQSKGMYTGTPLRPPGSPDDQSGSYFLNKNETNFSGLYNAAVSSPNNGDNPRLRSNSRRRESSEESYERRMYRNRAQSLDRENDAKFGLTTEVNRDGEPALLLPLPPSSYVEIWAPVLSVVFLVVLTGVALVYFRKRVSLAQ